MASDENMRNQLCERLRGLQLFIVIFVAIVVLHGPLLHLPFFWDEAGFYVPAAYDLAHFHSLIPQTTLDTGHPPLPAAYLALWFSIGGLKPVVARLAQLLLAALALTNVFLLARKMANWPVATASTIATAIYPCCSRRVRWRMQTWRQPRSHCMGITAGD